MDILPQLILNSVIAGAVYGLVALGFNLAYGATKFFNLAHGAIAAIGGYTAFFLTRALGAGVPLGIAAGVFAAGLAGYGLDRILFSPPQAEGLEPGAPRGLARRRSRRMEEVMEACAVLKRKRGARAGTLSGRDRTRGRGRIPAIAAICPDVRLERFRGLMPGIRLRAPFQAACRGSAFRSVVEWGRESPIAPLA